MPTYSAKFTISEVLKRVRADHGLSQLDLANILNVEQSTVQRWESGAQLPRGQRAVRLNDFLRSKGVPFGEKVLEICSPQTAPTTGGMVFEVLRAGLDPEAIPPEILKNLAIKWAHLMSDIVDKQEQIDVLQFERSALLTDVNNLRRELSEIKKLMSLYQEAEKYAALLPPRPKKGSPRSES